MMSTVILLVSLIWEQFPGSFKHPRSFIECSHYLSLHLTPPPFLKKKFFFCFPPKLFVSFFKLGEVTIDRWGYGLLLEVAAFTAGQGTAPRGPTQPGRPTLSCGPRAPHRGPVSAPRAPRRRPDRDLLGPPFLSISLAASRLLSSLPAPVLPDPAPEPDAAWFIDLRSASGLYQSQRGRPAAQARRAGGPPSALPGGATGAPFKLFLGSFLCHP